MKKKSKEFYADAALVVVALIWGLTFLPTAIALKTNGVYVILFWRFLIASALMLAVCAFFTRKLDFKSLKYGAIVGAFLFAGFALQTFALKYAPSSTVAFITGLVVVLAPIINYLLFGFRVRAYTVAGALACATGLYFLCAGEVGFGLGEILALACAVAYTLEIVLAARFVNRCEIFVLVTAEFAVTCVLSLICAFIFEGTARPNADGEFIAIILVLAVFATVVAFFTQNIAQRYTTPVKTVLILTLEPVSAGVAGYYLGGEILSASQIAGAAVILAGILISEAGSYIINRKEIY